MSYYVVNRLANARVHLLQNSIKLSPKGEKGDSRRIPDWARNHPDVLALEKGGKVLVLSEDQYRERLGQPAAPTKKDDVAPLVTAKTVKEEPPTPPEPEPEPTPPVVEETDEDGEEEESTDTSDLLSLADFKQLNKGPQLDVLKGLGIYEESHAERKANAEDAYEVYLAEQS